VLGLDNGLDEHPVDIGDEGLVIAAVAADGIKPLALPLHGIVGAASLVPQPAFVNLDFFFVRFDDVYSRVGYMLARDNSGILLLVVFIRFFLFREVGWYSESLHFLSCGRE